MKRVLALALFVAPLAIACGGELPPLDPALRRRAVNLPLTTSTELRDRPHRLLGEVSGFACQQSVHETVPFAGARADLRLNAANMGADAITDVLCMQGGVDWRHNCWSTVRCTGDAVRLSTPPN